MAPTSSRQQRRPNRGLELLRQRLMTAQRELIEQVVEADMLPSENALRKIADLEIAIGAVENLMDEG
jgi:hypothetical protein